MSKRKLVSCYYDIIETDIPNDELVQVKKNMRNPVALAITFKPNIRYLIIIIKQGFNALGMTKKLAAISCVQRWIYN
jgi:hypothetical protein